MSSSTKLKASEPISLSPDEPPDSSEASTRAPSPSSSARSVSASTASATLTELTRTTWGGKFWLSIKWIGNMMLDQWFLIGIGVVIALAHSFPNVGRDHGVVHAEWSVNYLLVAIIFFISGLSLSFRNLYLRLGDWKLHLSTQVTSFLFFPTVVYAIVNCVRAADPSGKEIDRWALVGMVVMGCMPTTVASNVVMTGQAGGDEAAATIEVVFGNTLGVFLTPALLQMFMRGPWYYGAPIASSAGGTGEIYRQVIMQLGYTVFIPLFVGEVIQYLRPDQTQWVRVHCRLGKISSLCLLGVIWSTFSNAFYENVFTTITGGTVAFILLVDIGLYAFHSLLLFFLARHLPLLHISRSTSFKHRLSISTSHESLFDAPTTIALLFCGAAKGVALGGPIVSILYGGQTPRDRSLISLPLVLYQGSQVALGQGTVVVMRAWKRRIDRREQGEGEVAKEHEVDA